MSRVKARDTKPEWVVRRLLYAMGHRYRLQAKDLPGPPDIVFRGQRNAIGR
jgi:DNA mismatch endonuclease, patch repair protein